MTPEGRVKEAVKKLLRAAGAYYYMPVPQGYGAATVDFLVCYRGRFAAIETKASGKKPTKRQEAALQAMHEAGAATFVIDGVDSEGMRALERWLEL